jgi:hypothetical protein
MTNAGELTHPPHSPARDWNPVQTVWRLLPGPIIRGTSESGPDFFHGGEMNITILLNDVLYKDLQAVAAATGESGCGPAAWAGELIASELASRRLSAMPGRWGGETPEPVTHRLCLPV